MSRGRSKGNEPALLNYWKREMAGGHPGDFKECTQALEGKKGITDPNALCQWLHIKSTGFPAGHAPAEQEPKK